MRANDSSEIIYFDNISIPISDQVSLGFPKKMRYYAHNVVVIDGKYYYAKKCTTNTLINELLGTYFSNLIGLDVVDYRIGKTNNDLSYLYALSEIFYKDDYTYTTVEDMFASLRPDDTRAYSKGLGSLYVCDTSILSLINSPQLIDSALKMTAVDLKMGQVDRYNYNVVLRDNGIEKELEKVFDFGWSYDIYRDDNIKVFYNNPFILVKKDYVSLSMLASRYPEFGRCAAILSSAPVGDVIRDIEKENNIKVTNEDFKYYVEKDKEYTKVLRKSL